jgi:hypothetical protein
MVKRQNPSILRLRSAQAPARGDRQTERSRGPLSKFNDIKLHFPFSGLLFSFSFFRSPFLLNLFLYLFGLIFSDIPLLI